MKLFIVVETVETEAHLYVYETEKERYEAIKEGFEEALEEKVYSDKYMEYEDEGFCLYAGGIAWIKELQAADLRWELFEINMPAE